MKTLKSTIILSKNELQEVEYYFSIERRKTDYRKNEPVYAFQSVFSDGINAWVSLVARENGFVVEPSLSMFVGLHDSEILSVLEDRNEILGTYIFEWKDECDCNAELTRYEVEVILNKKENE